MRVAISAIALLACTSLASAADLGGPTYGGSLKDGPAPTVYNWTGLYVGGHAGYGWGEMSGDALTRTNPTVPYGPAFSGPRFAGTDADNRLSIDMDGWLAGGQVGYNLQSGNVVFGLEVDVSGGDVNGSGRTVGVFTLDEGKQVFDKRFDAKLDYIATARLRLGYAAGRVMPFVTGGLAWARASVDTEIHYSAPGFDYISGRGSDDRTHVGWTIGGGLEAMLAPNWTVKAEYLYVNLGKERYEFTGTRYNENGDVVDANWSQDAFDADLDFHTVRLGVNYKFGN